MAYEIGGSKKKPSQPKRQPTPQVPSAPKAPSSPTPGGGTPQPSPYYGSSAPALTNLVPLTGNGGGGGGGGTGGSPVPGGGGEGWGSFGSYDQWAQQFQQEHGRTPNEQDVYDFIDSQNFLQMTGRPPTQEEWLNRYYTGAWTGSGGGGGWGGGGYGGYGGGGQQMPFGWNPNLTFWNIR